MVLTFAAWLDTSRLTLNGLRLANLALGAAGPRALKSSHATMFMLYREPHKYTGRRGNNLNVYAYS